jgi:hypothetical protein
MGSQAVPNGPPNREFFFEQETQSGRFISPPPRRTEFNMRLDLEDLRAAVQIFELADRQARQEADEILREHVPRIQAMTKLEIEEMIVRVGEKLGATSERIQESKKLIDRSDKLLRRA